MFLQLTLKRFTHIKSIFVPYFRLPILTLHYAHIYLYSHIQFHERARFIC
jgi:hypothetical protein